MKEGTRAGLGWKRCEHQDEERKWFLLETLCRRMQKYRAGALRLVKKQASGHVWWRHSFWPSCEVAQGFRRQQRVRGCVYVLWSLPSYKAISTESQDCTLRALSILNTSRRSPLWTPWQDQVSALWTPPQRDSTPAGAPEVPTALKQQGAARGGRFTTRQRFPTPAAHLPHRCSALIAWFTAGLRGSAGGPQVLPRLRTPVCRPLVPRWTSYWQIREHCPKLMTSPVRLLAVTSPVTTFWFKTDHRFQGGPTR